MRVPRRWTSFLSRQVVGWIVALVLSLTSEPTQTTVVVNQAAYPPGYPSPGHSQLPPPIPPYQQYPAATQHPASVEPTAILPPLEQDPWGSPGHDRR